MYADAALREWECDPARADAELERGTVTGQAGKDVDNGIDDRGLEHVGGRLVVPLRHGLAEVQRLQKTYTPFAYVPGTRFHASFGHLVGYSAMYYTYQWSLVIAKDLLTPFEASGLMARDVTFRYRDKVLVPGGSRDAAELVRDFLGRDYDFAAYERYLAA